MPRSKASVLSQSREVWHAPLQHNTSREKWEKVKNPSKSLLNTLCGSLSLEAFPDMSESNSSSLRILWRAHRTSPCNRGLPVRRDLLRQSEATVNLKREHSFKTRLINIKLALFTNNKYSKWYYKDNRLLLKRSKSKLSFIYFTAVKPNKII